MATLGELVVKVSADTSGLNKALADAERSVGGTAKAAGGLGTTLKNLAPYALGAGVALAGAAALGKNFADAASNLNEAINKSSVVFGKYAGTVQDFAETSGKSFGISKRAANEYAGTIGTILGASGLAAEASAGMSVEVVKLAADLASFNNIPIDVALEKLRSGLVGEAEPMRTVGVLLSEAAVKSKAYEMGIAAVGAELTEGQKVQARYAVILQQTATAQGDFARTADGAANQQRILSARFEDLRAKIGSGLLPVMNLVLKAVNDLADWTETKLIPAVGAAASKIGDLAGVLEGPFKAGLAFIAAHKETVIGALAAIGAVVLYAVVPAFVAWAAATIAATWPILAIVAAAALLGAGLALLIRNWDAVWGAMQAAPAAILNWLKANWGEVLKSILLGPIYVVISNWERIWKAMPAPVQGAMNLVAGIVETVINGILDAFSALIDKIADVAEQLNRLPFVDINVGGLRDLQATLEKGINLTMGGGGGGGFLSGLTGGIGTMFSKLGAAAEELKAKTGSAIPSIADLGSGVDALGAATEKLTAAVDILEDGIISLKEASEKGVPAWAAARFEMEAAAKVAGEELAESAWRAQVELLKLNMALTDQGLTGAAFEAALKVEEGNKQLRALADALGEAGLSGAAFSAAIAVEAAKDALEATQQALSGLFGRPTAEQAQLDLEQAELELQRLMAIQSGASEEYIAQLDEQIKRIGNEIAIRDKEHEIMKLHATLADATLLTEGELKEASRLLTEQIGIQSRQVVTAAQEAQRFSEVAKGFADYQYWLGRRIGDATDLQINAKYREITATDLLVAKLGSIAPAGYQMGTPFVPATGIYTLHRSEAVLNPAQAERYRRGQGGGGEGGVTYNNYGRYNVNLPNVRDHEDFLRQQARLLRGV